MSYTKFMVDQVARAIPVDPDLRALSNQVLSLKGASVPVDVEISLALGLSYRPFTSSMDASYREMRRHFPAPHWCIGWEDCGNEGWTGPMAWLSNRKTSHVGFENAANHEKRFYTRVGWTIETTLAGLLLYALSFDCTGPQARLMTDAEVLDAVSDHQLVEA